MTLGEKLSKLRKEYNYTQEQLADILGVSRQSISKWESDIAYPENDKLIKMGKLFECSMDYLLNEDITEKQGKNAHGFFAVGLKARGVFSIGLMARGIVSLGMLSLGVISIGVLSLGLLSAGVFSAGLLSFGSIALGLFAAGAISVGLVSFGALSVGCFSTGALAVGKYAAYGDHAYGMIAIGKSVAKGSVYSHIGDLTTADIPTVVEWLDANVPAWLGWAKGIFKFFIQ